MAYTSKGLKQLGFTPDIDFRLEVGDSGLQMTWLSKDAQPTVTAVEAGHVEWQTAYDANETAKTTGRNKLVALGLTTDELDALGIE